MQTQSSIIREYANDLADGFLNDLAISRERNLGPILDGENALIDAFLLYIRESYTIQHPLTMFKKRRKK